MAAFLRSFSGSSTCYEEAIILSVVVYLPSTALLGYIFLATAEWLVIGTSSLEAGCGHAGEDRNGFRARKAIVARTTCMGLASCRCVADVIGCNVSLPCGASAGRHRKSHNPAHPPQGVSFGGRRVERSRNSHPGERPTGGHER